mmetsp:Transcript_12643/g.18997  ORF Transcript_12643/g.18997 Transcript_12643/m.18997 type:complete len:271 (+) Transcript_12643:46-858(+)
MNILKESTSILKDQVEVTYGSSLRNIVDISNFISFRNGVNESEIIDNLSSYGGISDYASRNIGIGTSYRNKYLWQQGCQEGEYGFYEESYSIEENEKKDLTHSDCCEKENLTITFDSSDKSIICALENGIAPIICRSFQNLKNIGRTVAHISLPGFRIVQDENGEAAEFKFILTVDDIEYVAWRRFSDFRKLAMACNEYMKLMKQKDGVGLSFHNTLNAWNDVLRNRPWFYQCLNINYLVEKSLLLESFMKNLFFEVMDINIMMEFVSSK